MNRIRFTNFVDFTDSHLDLEGFYRVEAPIDRSQYHLVNIIRWLEDNTHGYCIFHLEGIYEGITPVVFFESEEDASFFKLSW